VARWPGHGDSLPELRQIAVKLSYNLGPARVPPREERVNELRDGALNAHVAFQMPAFSALSLNHLQFVHTRQART
jgi:hypothetical protein